MSERTLPFDPTKFYRKAHLFDSGYVSNAQTLSNWISAGLFPAGRLIGPNVRAWTGAELNAHYEGRPSERKELPQLARHRRKQASAA
jgi:hypothetical protein